MRGDVHGIGLALTALGIAALQRGTSARPPPGQYAWCAPAGRLPRHDLTHQTRAAMRVLIASTAGSGHFAPLVPFARALRDTGHAVRVAAPASFAATVDQAGFDHVPLADAPQAELAEIFARVPMLSMDAANAVVVGEVFAGADVRAALPAMQASVEAWRPDVIVREAAELSSYLAAERYGIPHVHVAVSLAAAEDQMLAYLEKPLLAWDSHRGVPGLVAAPRLTLVPASLEHPGPVTSRTHRFRHPAAPVDAPALPSTWWPTASGPLVYLTLGSVAATVGFFPELYRALLAALADLPVRVLLTLGEAAIPRSSDPVPANCHVERWWPQEQVMSRATALITHGGFGTTMYGVSCGIPMIVVPLFALDQFVMAQRIQEVGAGISLSDTSTATTQLRGALERLLADAAFGNAARGLADEIAQLPPPAACVPILEELVNT